MLKSENLANFRLILFVSEEEVSRESEEMSTATCSITRKTLPNQLEVEDPLFKTTFTLKKVAVDTLPKKITVSTKTVTLSRSKSCTDPDWEEWRSGLNAIGGSDFASLLGHGYTSPRKQLKQCLGYEPRKPPSSFSKRFLDHGKKYEQTALKIRNDLSENCVLYNSRACPLERTLIFDLLGEDKAPSLRFSVTPDAIGNRTIFEVKCPFMGSHGMYSTAAEFAQAWRASHPQGKESYFLQALFYSELLHWKNPGVMGVVRDTPILRASVCFVNNDDTAIVIEYVYGIYVGTQNAFYDWIDHIQNHASPTGVSTYRVKKEMKDQVTTCMKNSLYGVFTSEEYNLDASGNPEYIIEEETLEE